MKFHVLFKSSTSITLELENKDICETKPYKLFVNQKLYLEDTKNVISIFSLQPQTAYTLLLDMNGDQEELVVVTEEEYVCLNVKDFGDRKSVV